jgi:hypothetical protein
MYRVVCCIHICLRRRGAPKRSFTREDKTRYNSSNPCHNTPVTVQYMSIMIFLSHIIIFWVKSVERLYTVRGQSMSGVFQNIDPPPLHRPATAASVFWAGGGHTRWVERGVGGGSIFWKTPETTLNSTYVVKSCLYM